MRVSRSAYYHWRGQSQIATLSDFALEACVCAVFEDSKKTYGTRRLVEGLKKRGFQAGRYKIRRIMQKKKRVVRYPKRFRVTTDSQHNLALAPNTLNRGFNVGSPNQVWTGDITYVWTLEGWLYVAIIMDLYSRQIIGWAVDTPMRTELCSQALSMAYWRKKPPPGVLHHSDRGSQYASHEYREQLCQMKMQQSMSRKGNCWDNAPTERFFRSMKHEHLNSQRFASRAFAKSAIMD